MSSFPLHFIFLWSILYYPIWIPNTIDIIDIFFIFIKIQWDWKVASMKTFIIYLKTVQNLCNLSNLDSRSHTTVLSTITCLYGSHVSNVSTTLSPRVLLVLHQRNWIVFKYDSVRPVPYNKAPRFFFLSQYHFFMHPRSAWWIWYKHFGTTYHPLLSYTSNDCRPYWIHHVSHLVQVYLIR